MPPLPEAVVPVELDVPLNLLSLTIDPATHSMPYAEAFADVTSIEHPITVAAWP